MSAKGSELKRVRQSRKSNAYNKHYKSRMNSAINNFLSLDKKDAIKELPKLIKIIDQTANKGVIHKNKANNKKSKLASHINK
ncbi:MAG: 30S ribosomal protein S20 [Candidatus Marinimicrobia bacterium]|nr:30S ribosomal protein S20 [Candidatus Neomarinimicrobiota bacterium]|tara:strand:- start:3219 stop:3464 length:246 start_codon:yes stop_codon:yes gene_type:complete